MKVSGKPLLRVAAPLAVLALLTGCSDLRPGTAATVNGDRISMHEVRDLAEAQCDAVAREASGQPGSEIPMTQVQNRSLGLLLEVEKTKQYAEAHHLHADPRLVQAFWSQYRDPIAQLPEHDAEVLGKVFHDLAETRALLVAAGSRSTGQQPRQDNLDSLTQAGLDVRGKWADSIEVHTDPRFSPDTNGDPGSGGGSVSKARSDFAKKASAPRADPSWVAGLPAGQKCG